MRALARVLAALVFGPFAAEGHSVCTPDEIAERCAVVCSAAISTSALDYEVKECAAACRQQRTSGSEAEVLFCEAMVREHPERWMHEGRSGCLARVDVLRFMGDEIHREVLEQQLREREAAAPDDGD